MTRRIFNRTANTINDTPPITMADTENSFLLLALFAVLIPTINMIIEGKLYASTLPDNVAAIALLEKIGFENQIISVDGAILVAEALYDEENDELYDYPIKRYAMDKECFGGSR